ncbi:hypothetical protein [Ktedonobacter sp. SOSP1-85]|uniref:hypothetical protein n=1 Tax=Ktedonobacter sp. SOSP1-85 TaxID=2778367 RepID=UPI001915CB7E|nr:hypothetical protein [Ktedonobacter sp. SOSP1-85]
MESIPQTWPRKAEPPGQERNFGDLALEHDGCFTEIKLCPLSRRKVERDIHWLRRRSQLLHEQTHGRFSDRKTEFAQFSPHAMGRPALLGSPALKPLVLLKPFLDVWQCRVAHRRFGRCLTLILTFIGRWLLRKELGNRIA